MPSLTHIEPGWLVLVGVIFSWIFLSHFNRRFSLPLEELNRDLMEVVEKLERQVDQLRKSQTESLDRVCRSIGRLGLQKSLVASRDSSRRFGIDKKHQVFGLAQQGLKSTDISRRLQIYQGETELVLGLKEYVSTRRIWDEDQTVQ